MRRSLSFWSGKGGTRISSPKWGRVAETKTRPGRRVFQAGRAGFEPAAEVLPPHSLSRRAQSASLAPSHFCVLRNEFRVMDDLGGGSGIRTHVGVTLTCFQDMRLKPLGHPSLDWNSFRSGVSASDFTISCGGVYQNRSYFQNNQQLTVAQFGLETLPKLV